MSAPSLLLRTRLKIQTYFSEHAKQLGLETCPETDPAVLDISQMLYYEVRGLRKIKVFLDSGSDLDMDWYIKDGDSDDFPIKALSIFINDRFLDMQRLWQIYLEWMIKQGDAEALLG